ncbi:hypothetical protein JHW43_003540 [Diplocarpon mali]|nr:hypothetical protein JHW43_003540 [Diplocarpon mali]
MPRRRRNGTTLPNPRLSPTLSDFLPGRVCFKRHSTRRAHLGRARVRKALGRVWGRQEPQLTPRAGDIASARWAFEKAMLTPRA